METDKRVLRRYELDDEAGRLFRAGKGDLIRLRTWDIFDRFLPSGARIADVGGGPGTHAGRLTEQGHEVVLIDPVPKHIEQANASLGGRVDCLLGDARDLDLPDASFDAVLLMGPLYHLPDPADRQRALSEARRVLRPGGTLISEVIPRHAWILSATQLGWLDRPKVISDFDVNLATGMYFDPDTLEEGGFYGYMHRVEDVIPELNEAGFDDARLVGVEGHAWLVSTLPDLLEDPDPLLHVLRLVESEPALLGMNGHLIAISKRE